MSEKPDHHSPRKIILASPRGFCAGVERAIAIVERALEKFGAPVYVKHAIVHNRDVVERLEILGAVFVEEVEEVPKGSKVIFSAHGVSPAVFVQAGARGLEVLDATCPLVTKVHVEARRFAKQGHTIFLIGHRNHVEVIGTQGEAPSNIVVVGSEDEAERVHVKDPDRVAYLTQTTLSIDDTQAIVSILKRRFPSLTGPRKDDICYATQNRQNAVRELVRDADLVLVVGSSNSSNSKRLVEVANMRGKPAYLVDSYRDIDPQWLEGVSRIGISAGASAPESIVQELVSSLRALSPSSVTELKVIEENVSFPLPASLAMERDAPLPMQSSKNRMEWKP